MWTFGAFPDTFSPLFFSTRVSTVIHLTVIKITEPTNEHVFSLGAVRHFRFLRFFPSLLRHTLEPTADINILHIQKLISCIGSVRARLRFLSRLHNVDIFGPRLNASLGFSNPVSPLTEVFTERFTFFFFILCYTLGRKHFIGFLLLSLN